MRPVLRLLRRLAPAFVVAGLLPAVPPLSAAEGRSATVLLARGDRLLDIERELEWLRCPLGQKWTTTSCTGTVLRVRRDEIGRLVSLADPGGREGWRLPTREEIAALRCGDCAAPGLHALMNGAAATGYWTGEENALVPGRWWSVDVRSFRFFGRTEPASRLGVLLVRARRN
jgi:hypothetical protein